MDEGMRVPMRVTIVPTKERPAMIRRSAACLVGAVLLLVVGACTPSPSGGGASPSASAAVAASVTGMVHAGPVCPVEKPGDPACADRPVKGAVLVVTTVAGAEIARATSAADGTFSLALPPGDYVVVPQPVDGLMGTARPLPFQVPAAGAGVSPTPLDVAYDTGIR
jgi:hypothetical protein